MLQLSSLNPSTNKVLGEVEISSDKEIRDKIACAHGALEEWGGLGIQGRVNILKNIIENFKKRKDTTMSMESLIRI